MKIRKTTSADIAALMEIFEEARGTIARLGINQWQNGYPSTEVIESDLEKAQSYCVELDGVVCGTFALLENGEPTYDEIFDGEWITGNESREYYAIHRVAIAVSCRGKGISGEIVDFAARQASAAGKNSLRIDTHRGNVVMRKMLEKQGFIHSGTIYLENGDERVAYEKRIK